MDALQGIGEEEELGRRVSSSKGAKRASEGRARHTEFLPSRGEIEISVDRLSIASLTDLSAIAEKHDRIRNRTFYGWSVVLAREATHEGHRVVKSPTEDNHYHADIVLPQSAAGDRGEQVQHAQVLADSSCWREAIR